MTNNTETTEVQDTKIDTQTAAETVQPAPTAAVREPVTREMARAKIFSARPKFEVLEDFFGVDLELRQPSLEVALQARNTEETEYVYSMLLDYAFLPGTNEKVFEEEDIDNLRQLPFGEEMTRLMTAVNKLLGINPEDVEAMLKDATKST
jgi:hypothetical protein